MYGSLSESIWGKWEKNVLLFTFIIESVSLDKKIILLFCSLFENIPCGYASGVPQQGTSNEYLQHTFSSS